MRGMKSVFADSGFWIALLNPRDVLHREADQLCSQFTSALVVTSEMVLTEVMNHFSESGDYLRRAASALVPHGASRSSATNPAWMKWLSCVRAS